MNNYFPEVKKNFGFGCMRLPRKGPLIDIEQSKKMVDTFLEAGFNYFDTAHGYMEMRNEATLKKCLTSRHPRESYILADKLSEGFFKKESQIRPLFEKQLKIAEELGIVVVIHSRDATQDTIDCLKKYNVKGVIHCFSGSVETAKIYVGMGYKIGIGGVVTFKNSKLYEVVQSVGLNNIVLETDSPYLAPVPFRGQKNSSKYIPIIAECVSKILDVSVEEVASITTDNARYVFDLD